MKILFSFLLLWGQVSYFTLNRYFCLYYAIFVYVTILVPFGAILTCT